MGMKWRKCAANARKARKMKILGSDYDGTFTCGGVPEEKLQAIAEWQAAIQGRLTDKDRQAAQKSRAVRIEEYAELRKNKVEVRSGHLRGKLLADVLEADLLEVGFASDTKTKKKAEKAKRKVG